MSQPNRISTKEVDYLEQDEPIRNQNFVCLSFISPEEVLVNKDRYYFEKYISDFTTKTSEFLNTMKTLFPDKQEEIRILYDNYDYLFDADKIHDHYRYFVKDKHDEMEKSFYEENNFQTCVRGLKVRGVYDTLEEAKARSEKLRKLENNKFSIYIAQVGCWCPWSPNPEHITDQEFAETELNTLMHKYQENLDNKAEFFKTRQQELMKKIDESEEKKKAEVSANQEEEKGNEEDDDTSILS